VKRVFTIVAAALGASAALLPASAAAQTVDSWKLSDAWRFEGSIYGFLPIISLRTMLPSGASIDSSLSRSDVLDHLKMLFLGSLAAQKGRWGGFTDVMYMDLGNGNAKTRDFTLGGVGLPADVTATTGIDMKAVVWTLAGSYRAVANPDATLDVLAGARLIDIKTTQTWQLTGNVGQIPLPGRSGSGEAKGSNWDAIVGVKGRVALDAERKWFVPYYLDVGTGQSDLTWQAMGGVGYALNWGDVVATWRYVDWNNKSGKSVQDLSLNGPMLAFTFRW
jgi:hypothetical protein